MSEMTVLRARLGAHSLHASKSKEQIAEYTAKARAGRRAKLEAAVIEERGLDRADPDFDSKLAHGISAYYTRMRLQRAKR
mgnify:FL=1